MCDKNVFVRDRHTFEWTGQTLGDFFIAEASLRQRDLWLDVEKCVVRIALQAIQKMRGQCHCADFFAFQLGGEFGHSHVMPSHGSLDHFGNQEQPTFLGWRVVHVGVALIGLADHIVTQSQAHAVFVGVGDQGWQ